METIRQTKNEITEGIIWKQLLLFFFPILLGTFFQQLYNTIDSVIVGQFVGKEALASVGGSSAQIVSLVVGFFTGLSSGAAVTIAQFVGARKEETANAGLHNAYAIAAAGGIALTFIGILAAPFMLRLMNTPADIMDGSLTYLRIYFAGILFVLIYNMGSAILRATGDSKTPLYILIICCVINIILDTAFVLLFHMGVAGVAVATLIAQAVSAILVTVKLIRSGGLLRLSPGRIRFHGPLLKLQLKLGLPTGFESILFAITNIAIQAAINTFGTDTTAAWSAYGKLDAIFWMVSTAFGISITTFVGQNYGAGKMDRVRRSTRVCLCMDLAVSFVLVVILIASRSLLFRLFTTDETVVRIGSDMLLFITPWYIVYVFIEVLGGSLRGRGNVIVPVVITLLGVCLLRIIWLAGVLKISPTIHAIIFSYPVTWVITALAFIGYYVWKGRPHPGQSS
ncbi:MAG TPA: MATE family efflux transporter [Candidatus Mediterraneibacter surreyensis]|uniref:MATE family efflux transporter n=1 Tax=Candidatus Mediterraneibacter faecavium TaxID=2838668 RepID=A0A9D2TL34_9FIRM|nr:MATE family efflux transporter [Candidatus Mediterraneibacter surreyensis]HJC74275.1 MATE family efflux transporter [Candidatus Mediterraneibacter faecavium]